MNKTLKLHKMRKYLCSKKWFRELFPNSYFVKINGVWDKYSSEAELLKKLSFKEGEKIDGVTGPGISNWIFCQNQKCKSVINFSGSFQKERQLNKIPIWDFKCSCCGTMQHFIPDMAPFPCDENGHTSHLLAG